MKTKNEKIVIIGGGPAGYVAAIRLRQLGEEVILVEKDRLGGVCLNGGCIPSKTLFSVVNFLKEAEKASNYGVNLGPLELDTGKLNKWKDGVVEKLGNGITLLLNSHQVEVVAGKARLVDADTVEIKLPDDTNRLIKAKKCVIAVGSSPQTVPGVHCDGKHLLSPEEAWDVSSLPSRLAILGGGIVGVELAHIYRGLGSEVCVIEREDEILTGFDRQIRGLLMSALKKNGVEVFPDTELIEAVGAHDKVDIKLKKRGQTSALSVDKLIIAAGRKPNIEGLNLEKVGVSLDNDGFVKIDERGKTNIEGIYAIGDTTGKPFLACKAYNQALAVADVIAGLDGKISGIIPSVVFSAVEAAGVGLTEEESGKDHNLQVGFFPLTASGKAITGGRTDGFVKVIADKDTGDILGVHLAGEGASELISEAALALEAGIKVDRFAGIIRPHPTFSEALTEASLDVCSRAIHFTRPAGKTPESV